MIKIAVCDDDEREVAHVLELLMQYKNVRGIDCAYKGFHSGMELLDGLKAGDYDLVLLDVLMPVLSGIQVAREIRTLDQNVKLLFLSSSPEFAVESYTVHAYHYLLKPVREGGLFPLLDKALTEFGDQADNGIAVKIRTGLTHIPFSRLEYVEVMSKTVGFHLTDGTVVETFGTLATYEGQLLDRPEFLKVHRSYLVNMSHIETLDRKHILTHLGHQIPVARTLCTQIKEAYMRFLFSVKRPSFQANSSNPVINQNEINETSPNSEPIEPRILLVDDDADALQCWSSILLEKGCSVHCASSSTQAEQLAAETRYACILLDVLLLDGPSFPLCQRLHELTGAPIIFLSCLTDADSQLQGFTSGGIDYITKDTPAELFWAKVERRLRLPLAEKSLLTFGPLQLNQDLRGVTLEGQELIFTPTEFDLLWTLAGNSGQTFSPEALYRAVWGAEQWDDGQTVQVHMSRMRRKLEKAYAKHYFIETVWGEGYRFIPTE